MTGMSLRRMQLCLLAPFLIGCGQLGGGDESDPALAALLARQERVIDSVSKTIRYDSLLQLWMEFVQSPNPRSFLEPIHCESARLMWDYGPLPVERVQQLIEAQIARQFGKDAIDAAAARLPRGTVATIPDCRGRSPTRVTHIDGVSVVFPEPAEAEPKTRDSVQPGF